MGGGGKKAAPADQVPANGVAAVAPAGASAPAAIARRLSGSPEPVPGRCGSKLRNSDPPRYCQQRPVPGKTRCRLHGGASLLGPSHPSFVHGRYSSDLPASLAARLQVGLADPELLSLRAEMALLDARNGELLAAIKDGEAGQEAPVAARALREMEAAQRAGDGALARVKLEAVLQAIKSRSAARDVHRQVAENLRLRGYLQEREVKRLSALHQSIRLDELAAIMGQIATLAADLIPREALVTFQTGMRALLYRPETGSGVAP